MENYNMPGKRITLEVLILIIMEDTHGGVKAMYKVS